MSCHHKKYSKPEAERAAIRQRGEAKRCPACGHWKVV